MNAHDKLFHTVAEIAGLIMFKSDDYTKAHNLTAYTGLIDHFVLIFSSKDEQESFYTNALICAVELKARELGFVDHAFLEGAKANVNFLQESKESCIKHSDDREADSAAFDAGQEWMLSKNYEWRTLVRS